MDTPITADILDFMLYGRIERNIDALFTLRNVCSAGFTRMPRELCILPSSVPGGKYGVFSTTVIKHGTQLGPCQGQIVQDPSDPCQRNPDMCWEIPGAGGSVLGCFHYGCNTHKGCNSKHWLAYVQCARSDSEQNLEVVQVGTDIYFRVIKEIRRGDELLVWYGQSYCMYMGLPCSLRPEDKSQRPTVKEDIKPLESESPCRWSCVLCKRGFNSRSNLRSHMRIHTLEKPFTCKYCGRKFSQSSTLRNHVRLHTGEKPYVCFSCNSSYSQLAGLRAHQRSSKHKPTGSS